MARSNRTRLHVIDHPLIAQMLTEARQADTPAPRFRELLARIGMLLAYEATRDLRTRPRRIRTPMEPADGVALDEPVSIVPILRAGLGLAEGVGQLLPGASVGHIGMFRDERELRPVSYYQKLPADVGRGTTLLIDPMLATGGSALAGIELLRQHGCRDIRLLCLLAAPEGIERVHKVEPAVSIWTAAVDRELDDRGYILPGLGDAGDRLFGTTG